MVTRPVPAMVRCSCHGREIMAHLVDDMLVLRKRIHGQEHVLLTKVADGCIVEIVQLNSPVT